MSALDKLRRLHDRLGARSVAANWSQEPGHRFVRMDDVVAEIDRLLTEPETPEPAPLIETRIVEAPDGDIDVYVFHPKKPGCWAFVSYSPADGEMTATVTDRDAPPLTGPNERAAVPTDAEVEAAMNRLDHTACEYALGSTSKAHKLYRKDRDDAYDALRALIARRVAAAENRGDGLAADLAAAVVRADRAEKERDEARALLHAEMAKSDEAVADLRAEVERLKSEIHDHEITLGNYIASEARDRAEVDRLNAKFDLGDRMVEAIRRAAECKRDGLAGILGWIDDAKEAKAEVERLRAAASPVSEAEIEAWRARCAAENATLEDWAGASFPTPLLDDAVAMIRRAQGGAK